MLISDITENLYIKKKILEVKKYTNERINRQFSALICHCLQRVLMIAYICIKYDIAYCFRNGYIHTYVLNEIGTTQLCP